MKLIRSLSFLLIIVSAYSSSNWAGTWTITSTPAGKCAPSNPITLTQNATDVTASWIWQDSAACIEKGVANTQLSGSVPLPSGNVAELAFNVNGYEIDGEITLNGDEATFVGTDGTSIVFTRGNSGGSANWAGSWNSDDQDAGDCAPANPLVMSQTATDVTAIWTWAQTQGCINYGINGEPFSQTIPLPSGDTLNLDFTVDGYTIEGTLTIDGDQMTFQGEDDTIVVFYRSGSAFSLSLSLLSLWFSALYLIL